MLPNHRIATHPGEVLREEFLAPMRLSAADLARHINRPPAEVDAVLNEEAPVTAELAWLLGMAFDTTAEFWINLQSNHALTRSRPNHQIPQLTW